MKNMIKKLLLTAAIMSGITIQAGPFTNFLKTLWDFPCNLISEEATSALFIVGTSLLSYEGIKYWYNDANDKLYFIKKWGESAYKHPQITITLSLLTTILLGFNKFDNNNSSNKKSKKEKSKTQKPTVPTIHHVVTTEK